MGLILVSCGGEIGMYICSKLFVVLMDIEGCMYRRCV